MDLGPKELHALISANLIRILSENAKQIARQDGLHGIDLAGGLKRHAGKTVWELAKVG